MSCQVVKQKERSAPSPQPQQRPVGCRGFKGVTAVTWEQRAALKAEVWARRPRPAAARDSPERLEGRDTPAGPAPFQKRGSVGSASGLLLSEDGQVRHPGPRPQQNRGGRAAGQDQMVAPATRRQGMAQQPRRATNHRPVTPCHGHGGHNAPLMAGPGQIVALADSTVYEPKDTRLAAGVQRALCHLRSTQVTAWWTSPGRSCSTDSAGSSADSGASRAPVAGWRTVVWRGRSSRVHARLCLGSRQAASGRDSSSPGG